MHTSDLMTTSEVAAALGVSRQAVLQRVATGSLEPIGKLPTSRGAYLFNPADLRVRADEAEL